MSMEEMEKEIEDEMMNNAAVKIQAGFRGFKTRKAISSQYGVSQKRSKTGKSETTEGNTPSEACTVGGKNKSALCEKSAFAGGAMPESLTVSPEADAGETSSAGSDEKDDILGESRIGSSGKPVLSTLRSQSFPGPSETEEMSLALNLGDEGGPLMNPEPDVNLELDPDYMNRAAVQIQKNFRGYKVRKMMKRCPPG